MTETLTIERATVEAIRTTRQNFEAGKLKTWAQVHQDVYANLRRLGHGTYPAMSYADECLEAGKDSQGRILARMGHAIRVALFGADNPAER